MFTQKIGRVSFVLIACLATTLFAGCDLLDDILGGGNEPPAESTTIVLHQTGGFAGVSKITTIEKRGSTVRIRTLDERNDATSATEVSEAVFERLWKTLEANDIFTLPSNTEMLDTVADGFSYEISVEQGQKQHTFAVYAPDVLAEQTEEKRYQAIVDAIQKFAAATEFFISELPVTGVELEIMESFPIQVAIVVDGFLRDSCTELHNIEQWREGNTVHVLITTRTPKNVLCAQVITEIQERIKLDGAFPPGDYKVIVNGVERTFQG